MIVTDVLVNVITFCDVHFENSSCQKSVFKLECRLRVDMAWMGHTVPPIVILRRVFISETLLQR